MEEAMLKSLGFVCLFVAAAAQAAEVPQRPTAVRPIRGVAVNCNSGASIQAAVDAAIAPAEITIAGTCVENVLIRDKDISLRGVQNPALDGIRSPTPGVPALVVRGTVITSVSNLSFSNSPAAGVAVRSGANVTFSNCRFENNVVGLRADSGSFVVASDSIFTANANSNANASGAQIFCIACDVNGGGPASVAIRGAIVSFLDSVITGSQGIIAQDRGSLADVDCATIDTPHACGINVTDFAAIGAAGGTANLFAAGEFSGQLIADDRGTVRVDGSQQIANGGGPNIVDGLGELIVAPLANPSAQSVVRSTQAAHFARVLLTGNSVLKGSIQCSGAADAFLDPTVIVSVGSTVSGCEHASVP
jgi:hypothetical protein